MKQPTETSVVRAALRYLNRLPCCYARKVHGGPHMTGWPDIIGCLDGRMLALEAKRPGGKPTALQTHELERWATTGALVGWFTSLESLKDIIEPNR